MATPPDTRTCSLSRDGGCLEGEHEAGGDPDDSSVGAPPYIVLDQQDRVLTSGPTDRWLANQIALCEPPTFSALIRRSNATVPIHVRCANSREPVGVEGRLSRHAELLTGRRQVDMLVEMDNGATMATIAWRVAIGAEPPRVVMYHLTLPDTPCATGEAPQAAALLKAAAWVATEAPVPMLVLDSADRLVAWNAPLAFLLPFWDTERPSLFEGMTIGKALRALLDEDVSNRLLQLIDAAGDLTWDQIGAEIDDIEALKRQPWALWLAAYRRGAGVPIEIGGRRWETLVLRTREACFVMLTDHPHARALEQAALDAQEQARAWQEATFSTSPIGIVVTEVDGDARIIFANDAAGRIAERLVQACKGERFLDVFRSAPLATALAKALSEATHIERGPESVLLEPYEPLAPSNAVHLAANIEECEILVPSGSRWVTVRVALSHYASDPILTWWLSDITRTKLDELKWRKRERHLQSLIASAGVAPFELELSERPADVATFRISASFWRILGYDQSTADRSRIITVSKLLSLLSPESRSSFEAMMATRTIDHAVDWKGGFQALSGRTIWLSIRGQVWATGPDAAQLTGVISDVTHQQEVEIGLRRAKEQAEAADQAKSTFLATMSHEIRTPMSAIMGMLDELRETTLSDEQGHLLGVARESAGTLLGILNDILDLSKIEAGALTTERVPTDPRALLTSVVDAQRVSALGKGLSLDLHIDDRIPPLLYLDPMRLRQVMFNLVGNAIKFTGHGGVRVLAHGHGQPGGPGASLVIEVHDTGIGMSDEQMARCFTPFSQADGSTTRRYGGTGLGLSICRRLVDLMGGQIAVTSCFGSGCVFTVRLPLEPAAEASTAATHTPPPADSHRLTNARVLLAEDTPFVREVLDRYLSSMGIHVTAVGDGREALDMLVAGGDYDLVLTDLHMPGMDGVALVHAWRTHERRTGARRLPIVAITADVLARDQPSVAAAGFDDLMTKPATKEQIRQVLARWTVSRADSSPAPAIACPPPGRSPLDLGAFREVCGCANDAELIDCLGLLAETLDQARTRLRSTVGSAGRALVDLAHFIKGTARSAGALALGDRAAAVEEAAKGGGMDAPLLAALQADLDAVVEWCIAEQQRLRPST